MSKDDGDEAGLLTIEADTAKLATIIEGLEFRRMFNNPADPLNAFVDIQACLLYTSPSPRDRTRSRMPSSA